MNYQLRIEKIRDTSSAWRANLNNGFGSECVVLPFPKSLTHKAEEERIKKIKYRLNELHIKRIELGREIEDLKDEYYSKKRKTKKATEYYDLCNVRLGAHYERILKEIKELEDAM